MVRDNPGVTRGRVNHISQRGNTGCRRARGCGQRRGRGRGITVESRGTLRQRGLVQNDRGVTTGVVRHMRGRTEQRLPQHNSRGNIGNSHILDRTRLKIDKPLCLKDDGKLMHQTASRDTGRVCYTLRKRFSMIMDIPG